ncbi:DUF599 domain-containing protein [Niveibacterium sp. SC-1]|uniref:DUF599 domain-containing protein n=1 Tax=Niveibacterium sp. SC-1 TaxID=3135646 RepID=UPI00311DB7F0
MNAWLSILQFLSWQDYVGIVVFWACWFGYTWYAERGPASKHGLPGVMFEYRLQWSRQDPSRDIPVTSASLVANLTNSVSFYASTTIYIIAGLLALVGAVEKISSFAAELPFAQQASKELLELKLLLLLIVFITAYFKFTWSLRQFNFLCILIGGVPHERNLTDPERSEKFAQRMARVNANAGDEFNRGLRAYYYGIAAMAWFIQPWLFIAMTVGVTAVLYRRDFHSPTLKIVRDEFPPTI